MSDQRLAATGLTITAIGVLTVLVTAMTGIGGGLMVTGAASIIAGVAVCRAATGRAGGSQ